MFSSSFIQKNSLKFELVRGLSAGYTEIVRGEVVIYYSKSEHLSSRSSRECRAIKGGQNILLQEYQMGVVS